MLHIFYRKSGKKNVSKTIYAYHFLYMIKAKAKKSTEHDFSKT